MRKMADRWSRPSNNVLMFGGVTALLILLGRSADAIPVYWAATLSVILMILILALKWVAGELLRRAHFIVLVPPLPGWVRIAIVVLPAAAAAVVVAIAWVMVDARPPWYVLALVLLLLLLGVVAAIIGWPFAMMGASAISGAVLGIGILVLLAPMPLEGVWIREVVEDGLSESQSIVEFRRSDPYSPMLLRGVFVPDPRLDWEGYMRVSTSPLPTITEDEIVPSVDGKYCVAPMGTVVYEVWGPGPAYFGIARMNAPESNCRSEWHKAALLLATNDSGVACIERDRDKFCRSLDRIVIQE